MKKENLLNYFGGQRKTADALGVKQPTVCDWPDELPYSVLGRIATLQPAAWTILSSDPLPPAAPPKVDAE